MAMLCLISSLVLAQTRTISGTVTSESGDPIPNASVILKSTKKGTSTTLDGRFSINVSSSDKTLIVSAIGMNPKEVSIASGSNYVIVLTASTTSLDEVVVTGVGTATSKKKIAFDVASVSAKDLPKVPQSSIDKALIGKIAGAQITSTSGQPGQQANILLRGINSLGSTNPMIMVDGIEINNSNNGNGSGDNVTSRLSDLDLSNVERVEVIQGSAAATIYGAQGANGVIQIFTKKGQRGDRLSINVNSRVSFDNVLMGNLRLADKHFYNTDAEGYIVNTSGARLVQNSATKVWQAPNQPAVLDAVNDKPYKEQLYDNLGNVFRNNARTLNNSVSILGGGNKSDYAMTLSNVNQQSILFGGYDRSNISLNLGTELFKNFTIRSITQLAYSKNTTGTISGQNNINSPIGTAVNQNRFIDQSQKDSIGNYVAFPLATQTAINPIYSQHNREYLARNTRIIQNLNLNYKPYKFLELDYKLGIDNYVDDFRNYIHYQGKNLRTPGITADPGLAPYTGSINTLVGHETWINSNASAFLKFDFEKDFNLNIPINTSTQLTYDYRRKKYRSTTAQGVGFAPFPPYAIATAATKTGNDYSEAFATFGYLINQRIDYGNLFGVSAGFRSDFSSAFGEGSKPFTFPRADAYFRISEIVNSSMLSELKVRAAYGQAGIQPGYYDRQLVLTNGTYDASGYLALPSTGRNPLLEVTVSKEFEVGFDLGLKLGTESFSNVRLNATYWTKSSVGAIRAIDVAPSTGTLTLLTNAIDLSSDGFQFSLDMDILKKKSVTWDFGVRFGKSKSIVDKIGNGKDIALGSTGAGEFVLREGTSVGSMFGVMPLTSFTQTKNDGSRYIADAAIGDYEIVNGYVVNKTTRAVQFTTEKTNIGDPNPKFNMTFLNSFRILEDIGFSFQVDWVYGNKVYNQTRQWLYRDLIHSDFDQPVTINGQTKPFVNYYNSIYLTNNTNSHFVENGSFARLRDVTLSYSFNNLVAKTGFLKSAELSLTGRNLFTITNYTGMDPEAAASFNNPLRRGLDLYAFPNFKTFQVGLSLGF